MRRTMVPHARPLPKFDNPFLPQKWVKNLTLFMLMFLLSLFWNNMNGVFWLLIIGQSRKQQSPSHQNCVLSGEKIDAILLIWDNKKYCLQESQSSFHSCCSFLVEQKTSYWTNVIVLIMGSRLASYYSYY